MRACARRTSTLGGPEMGRFQRTAISDHRDRDNSKSRSLENPVPICDFSARPSRSHSTSVRGRPGGSVGQSQRGERRDRPTGSLGRHSRFMSNRAASNRRAAPFREKLKSLRLSDRLDEKGRDLELRQPRPTGMIEPRLSIRQGYYRQPACAISTVTV